MVTKATRMQTRRTSTVGKVPSPSELLEGEQFINMADKKTYSKDASGTVFQVSAAPGRKVGNSPVYESYVGSDLQYLPINTDGRLVLRHVEEKISDYATVNIVREVLPSATGDNVPGTAAALRIDTKVRKSGLNMFQWPLTVVMDIEADDGGGSPGSENVIIFGGGTKKTDCGLWGANIGISDQVSNPQSASIGFELTMGAKGLDPNSQRFGLLLAFGSAPANMGGVNEVTYGITFGAPADQCLLKTAINFDCTAHTALDFTTMGNGRGNGSVMKLKPNQKIQWANSLSSPVQAEMTFNGTLFQFNGMAVDGAANSGSNSPLPALPAQYLIVNVNGTNLKIPAYLP